MMFKRLLLLLAAVCLTLPAQTNPITAQYPGAIVAETDYYLLKNAAETTLSSGIDGVVTSVTVANGSVFRYPSIVVVDVEAMEVTSIAGNVLTVVRGAIGTAATSHTASTAVKGVYLEQHHHTLAAEVAAIETALGVNLANVLASADLDSEAELEAQLVGVTDVFTNNDTIGDANVADNITASLYLPLAGGTLTGGLIADNLGIEFEASDTNPTCDAGDYDVYADFSEETLKKCINGVLTDLDTGGAETNSLEADGAVGILNTEIPIGTGAGTVNYAPMSGDVTMDNAGATLLATDSVSANELNATGVETELEAVLDLNELQGAVTDAQVPDTITVDLATLATTATTANAGDSATAFFSTGEIADAQVADNITASLYLPLGGGTMTGSLVTDNLGIEYVDSDINPTCGAGEYKIYADLSEEVLKKCQNTVVTDLDTTAAGGGDAVQSNGTGADTTANFTDSTTVDLTFGDGGAGGPDTITPAVIAGSLDVETYIGDGRVTRTSDPILTINTPLTINVGNTAYALTSDATLDVTGGTTTSCTARIYVDTAGNLEAAIDGDANCFGDVTGTNITKVASATFPSDTAVMLATWGLTVDETWAATGTDHRGWNSDPVLAGTGLNSSDSSGVRTLSVGSNVVLNDQNNDLNAFYFDLDGIAVPANPAAGHRRIFVDSADDVLKVRTAAGTTVSLETGGADGVGYDEVLDEASGLTKRAQLNFTGAGVSCVDNAGATRTDCTISGGGSGITLEEADGTPTMTATTVQFDQADGFTVTDETAGVGQVDFVLANVTTSTLDEARLDPNVVLDTESPAAADIAGTFAAGLTHVADSVGTTPLDDGADTPLSGEYVRVDTVDQAGFEYRTTAEVLSDIGGESETHASEHQNGGADEVATATPAANAIPKAEADGDLANGWIGLDQSYVWTGPHDFGGTIIEIQNGTAAPLLGDCDADAERGRIYQKTDATSGQQLYLCEGAANGWVVQGDGGGAGGSWSALTAPTGAVSMVSDATAETETHDFQSAFTTGCQFCVQSSVGNPSGGTLFEVNSHDDNVLPAKITTSSASVLPMLTIQNDGTGDAGIDFAITGQTWAIGVDNNNDDFRISRSTDLGTLAAFRILTNGTLVTENTKCVDRHLQTDASGTISCMESDLTPITDQGGMMAFDTNAWATNFGALQVFDGTNSNFVVATLATDVPTNGQVPKWQTGGTILWEDDTSGGTPSLDTVSDPVAAKTFSFDVAETLVFDQTGAMGAINAFQFTQTSATATAGTILDVRNVDPDVDAFRAGNGTNGVAVDGAGLLTAEGTGGIQATDLVAASSVVSNAEVDDDITLTSITQVTNRDIDDISGQTAWGSAATKDTADLTISGVEVDFHNGGSPGYPLLSGNATPPVGACDAAAEYGRIMFDTNLDTEGSVVVCTSAGWKDIDDDGGAGGFTSFDVQGDDGAPNTVITDGNTLIVSGGTNISTEDGDAGADTLAINLDLTGITNGQFLYDNADALGAISQISYDGTDLTIDVTDGDVVESNRQVIPVYNDTGATLFECAAVYNTGVLDAPSGLPEVAIADNDGAGTMAAIGLVESDIAAASIGYVVTGGEFINIDTTSTETWSTGDEVYINASGTNTTQECDDTLTKTKPTGASNLIQKIGEVGRVNASAGSIHIGGALRTNDVPNTIVIGTDDTINTDSVTLDNTWAAAQLESGVVLDSESPNAAGDIAGDFATGLTYDANSVNEDELAATITFAAGDNIVLPIEAADQTTDGEIDFDTDEEVIEVGDDGSGTLKFFPGAHTADISGEALLAIGNTGNLSAERAITAGAGLAGTDGGANSTYTLAFDYSDAGADPALGAEECVFSNEGASDGGWVCEGTANTIETRFRVTPATTSDKIITFPDATGEVSLLGQTIEGGEADADFLLASEQNAGTDVTADLEEEAHASEHQNGGGDEVATATPAANAIPKAEADGDLANGWIGLDQGYTWTGTHDFSGGGTTLAVSAGAAPTANGAVAYDSTANQLEYGDNGTNRVVVNLDEAQTLTTKTLTAPTIGATEWTNANHAHAAANSGGQLDSGAIVAGAIDVEHVENDLKTYFDCQTLVDFSTAIPATADIPSMWGEFPFAFQLTKVWCETDANTATINLQRDDTSPLDMLSADLVCDTNEQDSCASGCDVNTIAAAEDNVAVGEQIDFIIESIGTVNRINVCISGLIE